MSILASIHLFSCLENIISCQKVCIKYWVNFKFPYDDIFLQIGTDGRYCSSSITYGSCRQSVTHVQQQSEMNNRKCHSNCRCQGQSFRTGMPNCLSQTFFFPDLYVLE